MIRFDIEVFGAIRMYRQERRRRAKPQKKENKNNIQQQRERPEINGRQDTILQSGDVVPYHADRIAKNRAIASGCQRNRTAVLHGVAAARIVYPQKSQNPNRQQSADNKNGENLCVFHQPYSNPSTTQRQTRNGTQERTQSPPECVLKRQW